MLLRETIELSLGCLEKAAVLIAKLARSRLQLIEMNKVVDRIHHTTSARQLHDDAR